MNRPDWSATFGCGLILAGGATTVLGIAVATRVAHQYGGPFAATSTAVVLITVLVIALACTATKGPEQ